MSAEHPTTAGPDQRNGGRTRLAVLGNASATSNDDSTAHFGPGKPLALLAYLACAPRRRAGRDELVSLLWADVAPDAGRHALRQTIWYIKKRLGEGVIASGASETSLSGGVDSDRDQFLEAVHAGDCAAALNLYAGEFLPDLSVPGGGEFERWADIERGRLRSLFVRCAERMARGALATGRAREAIAFARRARDADPWAQAGHRLLLEAILAANDNLVAAAEADAVERFLVHEEVEPEPATRAALASARAALRADAASGAAPSGVLADLVGREIEFARLMDRWNAARTGTYAHVHVSAPAGLGKSRLLQDFAARLRAKRSRVAHVRAQPGERHVPYATAGDLAAVLARLPGAAAVAPGVAATLLAMNPALSSTFAGTPESVVGPDLVTRRAFALAELARAIGEDAPLAILIDDLHWADAASRQVIVALLARLDGARALAVTTARPEEDLVVHAMPGDTLVLRPLPVAAVADLVMSVGKLPDDVWAASLVVGLHRASGGQPLGIVETLLLAREGGILTVDGDSWRCSDASRLEDLLTGASALDRRVRAISGVDVEIALLLAMAGLPLSQGAIAKAVDVAEDDAVQRLHLLEQRGFVRMAASKWLIAHDEIGGALVRGTPAHAVVRAHRRLGVHFAAGPDPLRPLAVEHFLAARDVAAVGELFAERLRRARRTGDWRRTVEVCGEFMGLPAKDALVAEVAARVPLRLRRRWRVASFGGVAAASLVVVLAAGFVVWRQTSVHAWVDIRVVDDDALRVARLPISSSTFLVSGPLRVSGEPLTTAVDSNAQALSGFASAIALRSGDLIYHRVTRDSGGIDIFRRHADGSEQRLTHAVSDDNELDVSPDEHFLLIDTRRWNAREHCDIGIVDLATGSTRALTRTDEIECVAKWSPGGGLIAFSRSFYFDRSPEVCVIAPDGSGERCATAPGGEPAAPVGWRGPRELLIQTRNDSAMALVAVNTDIWSYRPIHSGGSRYVVSPGGEYFVASFAEPDQDGERWVLGRTDGAGTTRRIVWPGRHMVARLADGNSGTPWLSRIAIAQLAGPVLTSDRPQLTIQGYDQRGDPYPVVGAVWLSLDSAVARTTPSGVLLPVAAGRARVVASVGGWRTDTATIVTMAAPVVRAGEPESTAREVFAERWTSFDPARWTTFGIPRSFVARRGSEPVLSLNGDSTFQSGVQANRLFKVSDGVAIRTRLSVALSELQWQIAQLSAVAVSPQALRAWDHRTGDFPIAGVFAGCLLGVPAGEGTPDGVRGVISGPNLGAQFALTPEQRRGGWVRVDLQVFPDGRCGFAVDGVPRAVSQRAFAPGDTIAAVIQGKAWRTQAVVGPVELWTGVRPGINWAPVVKRP